MIPILEKIFKKRGITKVEELSQDEQQTFQRWEKILSKESLSIEDLEKYLRTQIGVIEGKWRDYDIPQAKKAELIAAHTIYKALLEVLLSPQKERETLEAYLNSLV